MKTVQRIGCLLLPFLLMATCLANLSFSENISAKNYFNQLVTFYPPSGYTSQSSGSGGGLDYIDQSLDHEVNGVINFNVKLMMPDVGLKEMIAAKTDKYAKRDDITLVSAKIGNLGKKVAAIVYYQVATKRRTKPITIHVKQYYVPISTGRKGQAVFSPSIVSHSKERLVILDRYINRLTFKDEEMMNP